MVVKTESPEARRLEERLVLHGWMNQMLGYPSTRKLLEDLGDADEGFDADGRSGVCQRLLSRETKLRIPRPKLEGYDENIRRHVAHINARRAEPVVLKYFQHIAALYTEILLDNRFDNSEGFLASLNEYAESLEGEAMRFGEGDLDRCAFWMATGSGKTLLMHINYLQFLHYNGDAPLDNILLITPNGRLTNQHLDEMRLSDIPCERFEPEGGASLGNVVRATEITKIKENLESDKGVSVDVESFEGRNLIFVDEGHKGAATDLKSGDEAAWLNIRRRLSSGGYTFEYSATFGQALAKVKKGDENDLMAEYGKSILFDYSYRYFYGDGYGKDFRLLNMKDSGDENTDTLLAGNLLSFYEQKLCFDELGKKAEEYNLKAPLWILIGSKVNAVYSESKQEKSDVYDVLSFLHRFIRNADGWAEAVIERVLEDDGPFADFYPHLRKRIAKMESFRELHRGILRRVFRAEGGGGLVVRTMRGSDGQMGLGVSGAEEGYFGLVYVGEEGRLRKLIEERDEGIAVEEDVISGGLFGGIEDEDSPVNVLVGARKFVEGWSSWRVGSMGLINVGSGEGPMIIQLFGRGVRLQGRNFSLKRSGATDGEHPEEVAPVETLGVFGLKANYMAKFRDALAREDVDPDGYITLPPLPVKKEDPFFEEGLLVPRPPDEDFADHETIFLEHEEDITVSLDLSTRFETGRMAKDGDGSFESRSAKSGAEEWKEIEKEYLDLLDWSGIHHELLELKASKGYRNLIIPPDAPKALMSRGFYTLVCDESVVRPKNFEHLARVQGVVVSLLGKYVERFYHRHQQRWDSERMSLEPLAVDHGNLFPEYKVMVKRSREDLIESVEELISQVDEVYKAETKHLPNVYFDRHLYQPLLVEGDDIKSTPVGLKDSERTFIEKLRNHCRSHPEGNGEIFLLRNLSRGKGVGFFKTAGFYPDFIVWSKNGTKQRITFVEPHGMRNDDAPDHNDKVKLHADLKKMSPRLAKDGYGGVELDSFIISATPFEDLKSLRDGTWKREDFVKRHILFEDDLEERMPLILYGGEARITSPS